MRCPSVVVGFEASLLFLLLSFLPLNEATVECELPCGEGQVCGSDGTCMYGTYTTPENEEPQSDIELSVQRRDAELCSPGHISCTLIEPLEQGCGLRCDGTVECQDESDETNCPEICSSGYISCTLLETWEEGCGLRCDGNVDCMDESDEIDCSEPCSDGQISCTLLEPEEEGCGVLCDGTVDCQDESDETNCPEPCPRGHITCTLLQTQEEGCGLRCDGTVDCMDESDEIDCAEIQTFLKGCGDAVRPGQREACPVSSPSKSVCVSNSCCWQRHKNSKHTCFAPTHADAVPLTQDCTNVPPGHTNSRARCGWKGISEKQCLCLGCCYNAVWKDVWCYKPAVCYSVEISGAQFPINRHLISGTYVLNSDSSCPGVDGEPLPTYTASHGWSLYYDNVNRVWGVGPWLCHTSHGARLVTNNPSVTDAPQTTWQEWTGSVLSAVGDSSVQADCTWYASPEATPNI